MKKIFFALAMLGCGIGANAQYKKASFLNKDGRTYEIGGTGHIMNAPQSFTPEIFFNYGRETEKHKFYWIDLGVTLPSKFSTTATDIYTGSQTPVTGKSKLAFIYRINLGYYLIDKNNEANKILPYLTWGIGVKAGSGVKTDQDVTTTYFTPNDYGVGLQANVGGGVVFKVSEMFGIRIAGGYNFVYSPHPDEGLGEDKTFNTYVSSPYATVSLRLKLNNKE